MDYIGIRIRNGSAREIRLTELGWSVIENKEREIEERKSGRLASVRRKGLTERQAVEAQRPANCQAPLAERTAPPGESPGAPGKTPGLLSTPETPLNSCTPEPAAWRKIRAAIRQQTIPAFANRFIEPLIAAVHGDEMHLFAPDPGIRKHVMHRYLPAIRELAASENFSRVVVA